MVHFGRCLCTTAAGAAVSNYPRNFCNLATASFDPTAASGLGSYAFMAGSFSGASYSASSYVGGNVALRASSEINGYVLAGNAFSSGGSSTIRGYVSSQGSGVANASQASKNATLGASTTIDMRALPATLAAGSASGTGGSSAGAAVVSILYSRYL